MKKRDDESLKKARKIKAKLVSLGITQAEIGRSLGRSRSTVCCVINGLGRSREVERVIADIVGDPPEALFWKAS